VASPRRLADGLGERLAEIRGRIRAAEQASGRPPEAVEIVVAAKYLDAADLPALAEHGLTTLGENRTDELAAKQRAAESLGLAPQLTWDFIGPLQSRKARDVVGRVRLLHAVERESAVEQLHRRAPEGSTIEALVEVNVADDPAKSGILPRTLADFLDATAAFERVRFLGLMTMPPIASDPADARRPFAALRELASTHAPGWAGRHQLDRHLSMGTSADFEAAVAEGATLVRLGRGLLFGGQDTPSPGRKAA
jgi:hypothetical protein